MEDLQKNIRRHVSSCCERWVGTTSLKDGAISNAAEGEILGRDARPSWQIN